MPIDRGDRVTPEPSPGAVPGRSAVYAPRGMVATSQPLATSAGLRVLEEGGNTVDAAITAAAVLAVVEPHMTGIGGDVSALCWIAATGRLSGLSGHGQAGSLMTREALLEAGHETIPSRGAMTVTVPGAVRGWADLLEAHGTYPLAQALAPAIRLAEEGFPVSPVIARDWARQVNLLRGDEGARDTYLIDRERAPVAGEWFRNRDYADSLRMIAEGGSAALYGGELGSRVVAGVRALGGFLTQDDLHDHRSLWVDPLSVPFRGYRLWEIPPPNQGIAALQILRLLEPLGLETMDHNSPEYLHHLVEAKKLAYADLAEHIADPRFMTVDWDALLAEDYIDRRRRLIDSNAAMRVVDPDPSLTGSETVYLAAADAEGNMVSLINSIFDHFGSGIVVPGTGFALQNRGSGFTLEKGHPNTVEPGKVPFQTIIPAFVTRMREPAPDAASAPSLSASATATATASATDDEPWMAFGVMGGSMQPQGHVQVLLNMVLFGMDPQKAIEAPRFRHLSGLRLGLETPIPAEVRRDLRARGHQIERLDPSDVGGAQAILRLDRGWAAGSDPRKDGQAAGH